MGMSPFLGLQGTGSSPPIQHGDRLAHIHPIIKEVLKEYHAKFAGRVMIQRLLEHANTTFCDLPFLTPLVDSQNGKNWLCYNHCLGVCQHGGQCIFRKRNVHVDGNKLPPDFAKALVEKLKPGIDMMVRSEYPVHGAATPKKVPAPINREASPQNERQRHDT
jgi:hypothetical protein